MNSPFVGGLTKKASIIISPTSSSNPIDEKIQEISQPIIEKVENKQPSVLKNTIDTTYDWSGWALKGLFDTATFSGKKLMSGCGFIYSIATKQNIELALNFNGKEFIDSIEKKILLKCKNPQLINLVNFFLEGFEKKLENETKSWGDTALYYMPQVVKANILHGVANLVEASISDQSQDSLVQIISNISSIIKKGMDQKDIDFTQLEKVKFEKLALIDQQEKQNEKNIEELQKERKTIIPLQSNAKELFDINDHQLNILIGRRDRYKNMRLAAIDEFNLIIEKEIIDKFLLLLFPKGEKELVLPEKTDLSWGNSSVRGSIWKVIKNLLTEQFVSVYHIYRKGVESEAKNIQETKNNFLLTNFSGFKAAINSFLNFISRDTLFSNDVIVRQLEEFTKNSDKKSRSILSRILENELPSSISRSIQQLLQSKDECVLNAREFVIVFINQFLIYCSAKLSQCYTGNKSLDEEFIADFINELPAKEILKNIKIGEGQTVLDLIERYLRTVQKSFLNYEQTKKNIDGELKKLGPAGIEIKKISEACVQEWILKNGMQSIIDESIGKKGWGISKILDDLLGYYFPGLEVNATKRLSQWINKTYSVEDMNQFFNNTLRLREYASLYFQRALIHNFKLHCSTNESFSGLFLKNLQEAFYLHFKGLNLTDQNIWMDLIERRKAIRSKINEIDKTKKEMESSFPKLRFPSEEDRKQFKNLCRTHNEWLVSLKYEQDLLFKCSELHEKLLVQGVSDDIFSKLEIFLQFSKHRAPLKKFIIGRSHSIVSHEKAVMQEGINLSKEIEECETRIINLKSIRENDSIELQELCKTLNNEHEDVKNIIASINDADRQIIEVQTQITSLVKAKNQCEFEQFQLKEWNQLFLNLNDTQLLTIEEYLRLKKTCKRATANSDKLKSQYSLQKSSLGLLSDDAKKHLKIAKMCAKDKLEIEKLQKELDKKLTDFNLFSDDISALFGLDQSQPLLLSPLFELLPVTQNENILKAFNDIKNKSISLFILDNSAPFIHSMSYAENKQSLYELSGGDDKLFNIFEGAADDLLASLSKDSNLLHAISHVIVDAIPGATSLLDIIKDDIKLFFMDVKFSKQQQWLKDILVNTLMKLCLKFAKDDPQYKEKFLKAVKDTLIGESTDKPPLLKLFKIEKPEDLKVFGLPEQIHEKLYLVLKNRIEMFKNECGFRHVTYQINSPYSKSVEKLQKIFGDDRAVKAIKNLGTFIFELSYSSLTSPAKGSNVKGANIIFESLRAKVKDMKNGSKLGQALADWIESKEDLIKEQITELFLKLKDRNDTAEIKQAVSAWFGNFILVPLEEGISKLIEIEQRYGGKLNEELAKPVIKLLAEHLDLVNSAKKATGRPVDPASFTYFADKKGHLHKAYPRGTLVYEDVYEILFKQEPFAGIWTDDDIVKFLKELGDADQKRLQPGDVLSIEMLKLYFFNRLNERDDIAKDLKENHRKKIDLFFEEKSEEVIMNIRDASHFHEKRIYEVFVTVRDYILGSNHIASNEYKLKEKKLRLLFNKLIDEDKRNYNPLSNTALIDGLVAINLDPGQSKRDWIQKQNIAQLIKEAGLIDEKRIKAQAYQPYVNKLMQVMYPKGKDSIELPDETREMVWNVLQDVLLPMALSSLVENRIDNNALKRMAISALQSSAEQIEKDTTFTIFYSIIEAIKRFFGFANETDSSLVSLETIIKKIKEKIHFRDEPELSSKLEEKINELGKNYQNKPNEFKERILITAIENILNKKLNSEEKNWIYKNRISAKIANAFRAPPDDELKKDTKKLLVSLIEISSMLDPVKFLTDRFLPDLDPLNNKMAEIVSDGARKIWSEMSFVKLLGDELKRLGADSPKNPFMQMLEPTSDEDKKKAYLKESKRLDAELNEKEFLFSAVSYYYPVRFIQSLPRNKWDEITDLLNLPEPLIKFLEGAYFWTIGLLIDLIIYAALFPWIYITALINNYQAHKEFGPLFQEGMTILQNLAFHIFGTVDKVLSNKLDSQEIREVQV